MNRRVNSSRRVVERLEQRRLLALVISGTAGADEIVIAPVAGGQSIRFSVNGDTIEAAAPEGDAGLIVNAGDGSDTIRFEGLGLVPTTLNGEAGNDNVIIGDGAIGTDEILASVSVVGGAGSDAVTLNDALATNGAQFLVANPFNTYVSIVRNGGTTVYVDVGTASSAVEQVTVSAGMGPDMINVAGSSVLTTLNILSGIGDDSIMLGDDIDTKFNGAVVLDGGSDGVDAVTIDDSADSFGDIYTFAGSGAQGTLNKNSGGATLRFSRFDSLTLVAGAGGAPVPNNQTFRVNYLPAGMKTSILGGSGDDVLRVGDGSIVDLGSNVLSPVTFVGGGDFDRIEYLDVLGTDAAGYAVNAATLDVDGISLLGYGEVESLVVQANGANNFMQVKQTVDFMNVTLSGGSGDDVFVVGQGDLDSNLANSVSVIGGAGYDLMFLDDVSDDLGNDTYTFNVGLLNRSQRAVLWSTAAADAVDFVQLNGSANADVIRVNGNSATTLLRVNAGDGNDSIFVTRTTDGIVSIYTNPLVLSTGAGDDTVDVNSDFSGTDTYVEFVEAKEELAALDVRVGGRVFIAPAIVGNAARVLSVKSRLTAAGPIDVNDQTLIVGAAAASFATVNNLAATGYNGGTWLQATAGSLISTSAAATAAIDALAVVTAASVSLPMYTGTQTIAGDTIVRFTLAGDADLDRDVDFDDLLSLARNFGGTGKTWRDGNFNYASTEPAGNSDFDDLLLLAKNFGQSIVATLPAANRSTTRK